MNDLELKLIMAITRRLPIIPGMKLVSTYLAKWYLRKKRTEISTSVFGYHLKLDPNEAVERELCFWPQLFDWREIAFLRKVLSSGDVFLDLGANVGAYSLALSHAVGGKGLIIAVDADPYSATRLQKTVSENKIHQIKVVNVGLSDRAQDLDFTPQTFGNRGGGNFTRESNANTIRVKCVSLSQLLAMFKGVKSIRAAKLDLEGCEYRVLKQFFDDQPESLWPEVLLVERSVDILSEAGGDVNELIASKGYRLEFSHGMNFIWKKA